MVHISDGSGMEKVGFRRIRVYPVFEMSDTGISDMIHFEFLCLRALNLRVLAGIISYVIETKILSETVECRFPNF